MDESRKSNRVKRTQRDYSLAFKLQVVDEVEKGYLTYKQAQVKYGIQGRSTVLVWLRKHGRLNWEHGSFMESNKTPYKRIQELEKQVKDLKQEKEILNRAIDIADEMFQISIRKKCLSQSYKNIKKKDVEK